MTVVITDLYPIFEEDERTTQVKQDINRTSFNVKVAITYLD
jgi:hypothetical protein